MELWYGKKRYKSKAGKGAQTKSVHYLYNLTSNLYCQIGSIDLFFLHL